MKRILFIFPNPPGFSGQQEAGEQILRLLEGDPELHFAPVRLPGYPRTEAGLLPKLRFLMKTLFACMRLLWLAATRRWDVCYVSLCQTRLPLLRECVLLTLVCWLQLRRPPMVFSLHGNVFMTWEGDEPVARLFRRALRYASTVTVLGPNQQQRLTDRFLESNQTAQIVPNTCEVPLMPPEEVHEKQQNGRPTILHLGTIMEPKGYIDLIESIPLFAEKVDVVLCGKLATTRYDQRFASLAEARAWIEQKQAELGFRWVEGAYGEDKRRLFAAATIFVLPSSYPVEAQPLVLLEAMASGCAVITTDVGEIPSIFDGSAVVLADVSPESIATAVNDLIANKEQRLRLAMEGQQRFQSQFTMQNYRDNWRRLFFETSVS